MKFETRLPVVPILCSLVASGFLSRCEPSPPPLCTVEDSLDVYLDGTTVFVPTSADLSPPAVGVVVQGLSGGTHRGLEALAISVQVKPCEDDADSASSTVMPLALDLDPRFGRCTRETSALLRCYLDASGTARFRVVAALLTAGATDDHVCLDVRPTSRAQATATCSSIRRLDVSSRNIQPLQIIEVPRARNSSGIPGCNQLAECQSTSVRHDYQIVSTVFNDGASVDRGRSVAADSAAPSLMPDEPDASTIREPRPASGTVNVWVSPDDPTVSGFQAQLSRTGQCDDGLAFLTLNSNDAFTLCAAGHPGRVTLHASLPADSRPALSRQVNIAPRVAQIHASAQQNGNVALGLTYCPGDVNQGIVELISDRFPVNHVGSSWSLQRDSKGVRGEVDATDVETADRVDPGDIGGEAALGMARTSHPLETVDDARSDDQDGGLTDAAVTMLTFWLSDNAQQSCSLRVP